jgi:hypothetical protein
VRDTSITDCWAEKYGYSTTKEFEENAQKKFSLIETGVMDQPNCRLLLLNVCFSQSWMVLLLMLIFRPLGR